MRLVGKTPLFSRRALLAGVAAVALCLPLATTPAIAGHNGKRLQGNIGFPTDDFSGPFINILKGADTWNLNGGFSGNPDFTLVNANGYPTALVSGHTSWSATFALPRSVQYVLRITGPDGNTASTPGLSGSITTSGGFAQSAPFTPTPDDRGNGFLYQSIFLTAFAGGGPTDVAFIPASLVIAYDAGEIFHPDFVGWASQFGVLRFMDPQLNNVGTVADVTRRMPLTHWSYGASYYPPSVTTTTITVSGTDYSITVPSFTLQDKAQVVCRKASGTVTGPIRVRVNGGAFKSVLNTWGETRGTGDLPVNQWFLLTYDAAFDAYLMDFDNGGGGTQRGIMGGWPYEICVALCNKVGAHCWLNTPVYCSDASTNIPVVGDLPSYVTVEATYCKANLATGLQYWKEPDNEEWNPFGAAFPFKYASFRQALRNGGTLNDTNNAYGVQASLIAQAVNAVYGGSPHTQTAYRAMCGVQLANSGTTERWNSDWYVANGGIAAHVYCTHICAAGYFLSDYYGTAQEVTWGDALAGGDTSVIQPYVDGCNTNTNNNPQNLINVGVLYGTWDGIAASLGMGFCEYEAGYGPNLDSTTNVNALRVAAKSNSTMTTMSKINWSNFFANPHSDFPSEYVLYASSVFGIWALPGQVGTATPRWQAILDENAQGNHGGKSWLGRFGELKLNTKAALLAMVGAALIKDPRLTRRKLMHFGLADKRDVSAASKSRFRTTARSDQ